MNVSVSHEAAATVVAPEGEVDAGTVPRFRAALFAVVDAGTDLVVDLAGVTFVDSSALGVLVGAMRRAQREGGGFLIRNVPSRIQQVLHVSGLDRVLPIEP